MLRQFLIQLKIKISWVRKWATSEKKDETLYRLLQQHWMVEGIFYHGFTQEQLRTMITKYEKFQMVPSGYEYAELRKKNGTDKDLMAMFERKMSHLMKIHFPGVDR